MAATNGIMICAPARAPVPLTSSRSWPCCSTSATSPTGSPVTVETVSPISWWSWNSSGSATSSSSSESTSSRTPRSSSATFRSLKPLNGTSSGPEVQRLLSMVSGPVATGSVVTTEPAANLSSGSSVLTSTITSPRTPCGRAIRPVTSCMASADFVGVQQIDADVVAAGQRADHRAQGPSGPAAAPDDLAEVVRVDPDLEHAATTQPAAPDLDVVRMLDDALDQMLQGLLEHVRLRCRQPRRPQAQPRRPAPPQRPPRPRRPERQRRSRQRRPLPQPWPQPPPEQPQPQPRPEPERRLRPDPQPGCRP